jgi:hypothetical protein
MRVRWSPIHRAWLRNSDYGRYRRPAWLSTPGETYGEPDAPYEDELASAISIAERLLHPRKSEFFCQRCYRSEPQAHFIAPDVHGEPELYCLQVPAYSVVESSGNSGTVKHWGSPFGCHSVKPYISTGYYTYDSFIGPMAAYTYGRPLPADEVIDREWCARCVNLAANVRNNAAAAGEDETQWAREHARSDTARLAQTLATYYAS